MKKETTSMSKYTIHVHHYHGQTSVYDYEGWAHPRPDTWSTHEFKGTLEEARSWAIKNGGSGWKHYAIDGRGHRYELRR